MKRTLCLLIICALFIALFGCAKEEADDPNATYTEPQMVAGTLQTDLLQVERYNFDRANQTGCGYFMEVESGYYFYWWRYLYYADKSEPDRWSLLCSDPKCNHTDYECSAYMNGNNCLSLRDGRIFFLSNISRYPQFIDSSQRNLAGSILVSCALDGSDVRKEYLYEDALLNTGTKCISYLLPDGYVSGRSYMNQDGTYTNDVVYVDSELGAMTLLTTTVEEDPALLHTFPARSTFRLMGDNAFATSILTGDLSYSDYLCWFNEGELTVTDISQIPLKRGYLSENIVRGFASNDGYYDTDLLTGEKTKLADPQLTDSVAMILQPNCIIETTLLYTGESDVQTQEMRFFDGQTWHEVELPENLKTEKDSTFVIVALTTDGVIFRTISESSDERYETEDSKVTFYKMALESDEYKMEPLGVFQVK